MATTRVLKTLFIYRQEGKEGVVVDQAGKVGEAASQEYIAGAPLIYDSGTIKILPTGGADTSLIIGIAAKAATGTTGAAVPYYEANDYNLFEASLINGVAAYTLLGTEIGTAYGLIDSGDNWYVDVSNVTQTKVEVVGLIDPVSDINPRVIVRFIGSMQARVLQS